MMFPQENTVPPAQHSSSQEDAGAPEVVCLTDFVERMLGATKKNRLESILSELVIFGMNSGQWRHATFAQEAYMQVTSPHSLGPLVSGAYVAMGYGNLNEAIEALLLEQENVSPDDIWGLRAFIGMFMIFNESEVEAEPLLRSVQERGNEASQNMASQLLQQFFGVSQVHQAKSNTRVPGLPI